MTVQYSAPTLRLKNLSYIFILLALSVFLFTPGVAYAVRCTDSQGGTTGTDAVTINSIPAIAPVGQLLWRSATNSFELTCYQNRLGDGPDIIYTYLNPGNNGANIPVLGSDIIWGININGTEYDLPTDGSMSGQVLAGYPEVPKCIIYESESFDCKDSTGKDTRQKQTISYYIYAKKGAGASPGSYYQGPNPFYIFQVDGVGGLNGVFSTYRHNVTGVNQIYFAACGATVNFSPNAIELGSFFKHRAELGSKAGEKNFDVVVQKGNCSDNFKLLAQFDPGTNVKLVDSESISTTLDDGSEAGIKLKLKLQASSSYINFGNVSDLLDLTGKPANYVERIPYTVEAFWTKNTSQLEAGNISSSATITIFYN